MRVMIGGCPPLRLRSGVVIEDPLGDAVRFVDTDGTYDSYDAVSGGGDDLTESDVRVANRIIARMGPAAVAAALSRRDMVGAALAGIAAAATLNDDEVAGPVGRPRPALRRVRWLAGDRSGPGDADPAQEAPGARADP